MFEPINPDGEGFSSQHMLTSSIQKTVFPKLHTVGVGTTSEEELLKSVFFIV